MGVAGALAYGDFGVLPFDCYGTLIGWESGIVSAVRLELGDAVAGVSAEEIIAAFAAVEHEAEVPAGRPILRLGREALTEFAGE